MYYAKYVETTCGVVAFKTKAERDNWVNFKDDVSVVCGTTVENAVFQREPITSCEAVHILARKTLYDEDSREEHEFIKGMFLIEAF